MKRKLDDKIEELISDMEASERRADLVSRGLLPPPRITLWKKTKRHLASPFRWIGKAGAAIAWQLWGKRQYNKKVREQAERMKLLATYQVEPYYASKAPPRETLPLPVAQALHDEIIKTKIVKEELPKPDYDDGTN